MKQFQVTEQRELDWKFKKPVFRAYSLLKRSLTQNGYPYEVAICLTSKCESRCDTCARTYLNAKGLWDIQDMDWTLLKSIISQVAEDYSHTRLMLGGEGEPLLYPRFDDFIYYTRTVLPSTSITLYSNLRHLGEHYSSIIDNVDALVASLNFIDPDYYRKRTGVEQYYAISNLRNFLVAKGNRKPSVKIQLFTVSDNMKRMSAFVEEWRHILNENDEFMLVDMHNFTEYVKLDRYYSKPPDYNRFPCRQPFLQFYISASGHVYPCCMGSAIHNNNDKNMCLGNLQENSIKELVGGCKLKRLRLNHLRGIFVNTCKVCDVWKTFYNHYFRFNGRWW